MPLNRHIALVVPGFPKDEQDTMCLPAVQHFVLELAIRVEYVTVFSLHYPYTSEVYSWNGISVHPMNGKNSFWKRKFSLYQALKRSLEKVHTEHTIHNIHALWLNETTVFSIKLGKQLGIPVTATAHGQDVLPANRYLQKLAGWDRTVYCLSNFQKKYLQDAGIKNIEVTTWGLIPPEVDFSEKSIDFITVGNLIPLKRIDYFVELCSAFQKTYGEFQAVIVGDGPQRVLIEKKIHEHGLQDMIQLTGFLSHTETLKMMAQSRILVHASQFEGFGMTIIEALALQTYVLSTPVGVAEENPRLQTLVNDSAEDAAMLHQLLGKPLPDAYIYSIKETVDRYLNIYLA